MDTNNLVNNGSGDEPCNEAFSTRQVNIALIVTGSGGTVSLCMCVVAVSLVVLLRLFKIFTYRLAMYQVLSGMTYSLSIALFFGSINYNKDNPNSVRLCKAQACLILYFLWVKLLFTLNLTFHLFCLAVFLKNFKKLELFYILFSTLFPLLFVWVPFIHDHYGLAGAWCWIKDWEDGCASNQNMDGIIEQFALWYIPLYIFLFLAVVVVFVIVFVLLRRSFKVYQSSTENPLLPEAQNNLKQRHKEILQELLPLLAYPIIFCLISLIPIINRVFNAFGKSWYYLTVFHGISQQFMALFSSSVLIIHVVVIRCCKHKIRAASNTSVQHGSAKVQKSKITITVASSSTAFLVPTESDIDRIFD